jgi:hypothetical protein
MKRTLTTMLLTVSLVVNALFLYNRLEKAVYQEGRKDGHVALYKKIASQVLAKGRLTVDTPKGRILLVPQTRTGKPQPVSDAVADPNTESEGK